MTMSLFDDVVVGSTTRRGACDRRCAARRQARRSRPVRTVAGTRRGESTGGARLANVSPLSRTSDQRRVAPSSSALSPLASVDSLRAQLYRWRFSVERGDVPFRDSSTGRVALIAGAGLHRAETRELGRRKRLRGATGEWVVSFATAIAWTKRSKIALQ
jgi:hypothetical protein